MNKIKMEIENKEFFGTDKIDVMALNEEELDQAMGYYFKCPFREYETSHNFKPCLQRACMAFRANDKVFWCAMIEGGRGEEKSLHPIEMINETSDNW